MTGLPIHPTKGVNPRLVHCTQCGEMTNEIVLLGAIDYYTTCPQCGIKLIGGGKCPKCNVKGVDRTPLPESQEINAGICDACQNKNRKAKEEVEAGGVYWKCADCGSAGAIKAGHPLAEDVRKHFKLEAPEPCGIEFTKKECPVCSEHKVEEEK